MRVACALLLIGLAGNSAAAADLEVVCLERTPKQSSYVGHIRYEIGKVFDDGAGKYDADLATGLDGQDRGTARWPRGGEPVTWSARVANHGPGDCPGFAFRWTLDGRELSAGTWPAPLAAGSETTVRLEWRWQPGRHRLAFEARASGDEDPGNDRVEDFTDALSLITFVDRGYALRFRELTPQVANPSTASIAAWLQRHRARMNEMFEQAGCELRWRWDRIETIGDQAPSPSVPLDSRDGSFPDRFRAGEKDLRLGGSGYYDAREDIDYGLLHELGHQLGLIDLYRLNVEADRNPVSGTAYRGPRCVMNGCDHEVSAHSAGAMNAWHGKRRGYFGQYLYDLPATIRLRFLDSLGRPLEGARVAAHQRVDEPGKGERVQEKPKFRGTTSREGTLELPNFPVFPRERNEVGNRLRPNPFGTLSNHGDNGVFLLRVETPEMTDHVWFDVTEANLAYWAGEKSEATFDRQTNLCSEVQEELPEDFTESNASSWRAWTEQGELTAADDSTETRSGETSLRLDATGGFDNSVRYPAHAIGRWNLSRLIEIRVWCKARNDHAFQSFSPWVRLGNHRRGYLEWKPQDEVLNEARGKWIELVIPAAGGAGWKLERHGTPSLDDIQYVELHADTWDYGFTLWLDGLRLVMR